MGIIGKSIVIPVINIRENIIRFACSILNNESLEDKCEICATIILSNNHGIQIKEYISTRTLKAILYFTYLVFDVDIQEINMMYERGNYIRITNNGYSYLVEYTENNYEDIKKSIDVIRCYHEAGEGVVCNDKVFSYSLNINEKDILNIVSSQMKLTDAISFNIIDTNVHVLTSDELICIISKGDIHIFSMFGDYDLESEHMISKLCEQLNLGNTIEIKGTKYSFK